MCVKNLKNYRPVSRILYLPVARQVSAIYLAPGVAAGVCAAYPPC